MVRLRGILREKAERYLQERKEKKRIYKEAYVAAEKKAIVKAAARDARLRWLGQPSMSRPRRRKGKAISLRVKPRAIRYKKAPQREPGLFNIPEWFGETTLFGEAPRRKRRD